jgi:hypothetical protein
MSDILASVFPGATAVTKSDSEPIAGTTASPKVFAALYTGTGGNITVVTANGETVEFAGTVAGTILPVAVVQVLSTGTAATGIVALEAAPFSGSRRLG